MVYKYGRRFEKFSVAAQISVAAELYEHWFNLPVMSDYGNSTELMTLMTLSKEELIRKFLTIENVVMNVRKENNSLKSTIQCLEELTISSRDIGRSDNNIREVGNKDIEIDKSIEAVTKHDIKCNAEFGLEQWEVEASQKEFPWRVVNLFETEKKWDSWGSVCPPPDVGRGTGVEWMYGASLEHAFTGILRIEEGHSQPCHRHKLPEIYYILQV